MDGHWIDASIALLNVIVTAGLGWVVFRAGRSVVRLEQDRAVKEAWIAIDQVALGRVEHLRLLDAMFHPDRVGDSDETKTRRWLAYMVLNPLEAAWSSSRETHMPDGTTDSSERSMRAMLRDPEVAAMMQTVVYGKAFRNRCKELLREIEAAPNADSTAPAPAPAVATALN